MPAGPQPADDRVYRVVVVIFKTLFRLLGIRFDLRGVERIPATGAAVLAGNHISFLDFAFLGLAADHRHRLVRFMARHGVFRVRLLGRLLTAMGHIPVDRAAGSGAARLALTRLAAGELVGVFPEGTISRSWMLKHFHPGAVALAVTRGVPIIPVITWGGHRLITVDGHRSLRRRMPVSIWVGEPITPDPGWVVRGRERAALIEELTTGLRERMAELLDRAQREYPEQPRNPAQSWWLPRHLGGTAPDPVQAAVLDAARMLD